MRNTAPATLPDVTVPNLWPGETVVCLGTGPTLTREDVEYCRGKARVIAINNAYRLAPWADVLYACDAKWWGWEWTKGASTFVGAKYALTPRAAVFPGVHVLKDAGKDGLSLDPTRLTTGKHSGYQAIGLAVLSGAARVLLLGYDMCGDHFFGSHPDRSKPPYKACLAAYDTIAQPLRDAGVTVINCSRKSAIAVFPRAALREVLS